VPEVPNDKNNWAPRVGFAYSPHWSGNPFFKALLGENDASVIRGAFSMAYDPAFYNILLNVSTSTPVVFNNTIANFCTNVTPATACTTNDIIANPAFRLPNNPAVTPCAVPWVVNWCGTSSIPDFCRARLWE
jgi:hypothetical protein